MVDISLVMSPTNTQPSSLSPPSKLSNTMSAEEVAKAFVAHFYQAFDTGVDGLAGLYVSFVGDRG